jgi:NADH-quinone oxidoreductase subunit A
MHVPSAVVPIFLFLACAITVALVLFMIAGRFNPSRAGRVLEMPYESGMDPIHDTRRRFDVRFYLLAIAFLLFDVELLFLYPWAVATRPAPLATTSSADAETGVAFRSAKEHDARAAKGDNATAMDLPAPSPPAGIDAAVAAGWIESRDHVFLGAMVFIALLTLGFVYDWRKGVFLWR